MVEGWTPLLRAARLSGTDPQMLSIVQEMVDRDSVTPLQLNMPFPGERPHGWTALHMAVDGVAPLPARSQRLDLV